MDNLNLVLVISTVFLLNMMFFIVEGRPTHSLIGLLLFIFSFLYQKFFNRSQNFEIRFFIILFLGFALFLQFPVISSQSELDEGTLKSIGPQKIEFEPLINGNSWSKKIHLNRRNSDLYKNVQVSVGIPENLAGVELYIILKTGSLKKITDNPSYSVRIFDSNGNGKDDKITWVIPELNSAMFMVEGNLVGKEAEVRKTIVKTTTIEIETETTTSTIKEERSNQSKAFREEIELVREIEVGKPVLWRKKVISSSPIPPQPRLPDQAVIVSIGEERVREEVVFDFEFETPGPRKEEKIIGNFEEDGNFRKIVEVKSDYEEHYENVKSYTQIPENISGSGYRVKLYHYINNSKVEITEDPSYNVVFVDTDGNNLDDRIEWTVPQLSNQTFELEISLEILTVKSYPTVTGNWTVEFITNGTADLKIKAVEGTTWSDTNENGDLKLLEVKCGDEIQEYGWVDDTVVISDYSCDKTSYEISKVLTPGKHHLKFDFGGIKGDAYNDAIVMIDADAENVATRPSGSKNLIKMDDGTLIAIWEDDGNDLNCEESTDGGATWENRVSVEETLRDVAIATNGTRIMFLSYQTSPDDIRYKISDTKCAGFGNGETAVNGFDEAMFPSVKFDEYNNKWIACAVNDTGGFGELYYSYVDVGSESGGWSTVIIDTEDHDYCSIGVKSDGNVFIATEKETGREIDLYNSTDDFSTITQRTIYNPRVALVDINIRKLNETREDILITAEHTSGSDGVLLYSTNGGDTFTTSALLAGSGNLFEFAGCIDKNGNYHVVYSDTGIDALRDIKYINYTSADGWGTPLILANTSSDLRYASTFCSNYPESNRMGNEEFIGMFTDVTLKDVYFFSHDVIVQDFTPPQWSNNITSVATGSTYSPGKSYQFNVTWDESDSLVDTVFIEHNFTGSSVPHNDTVSNISNEYYFDVSDLAAGTYVWKEYSNNTYNFWNVTEQWVYVVNRDTVTLDLENNETWSAQYPSSTNTTGTGCPSQISCKLFRNDTGQIASNEDIILLGAESYNYTYNISQTQNYTAASASNILIITKGTVQPKLSVSPTWTETYPTQTSVSCSVSSLNNEASCTIFRNDTGEVSVPDQLILGASDYEYKTNTTGTSNYTTNATGETKILSILQNQTNLVDLYFRNDTGEYINEDMSVFYETQINATGNAIYSSSGTVKLYRNGTDVTSENSVDITLGFGDYEYKGNITGNQNYTSNSTGEIHYIRVNKKQTETYLLINGTRANSGFTQDDDANFTVELNGYPGRNVELHTNFSDGVWKLWDNGVSPFENISKMDATGNFMFLGNYSGNQNYTYSEESWKVTISSLSLVSELTSISPVSINQSKNSTVVGNCSCTGGTCNDVYIEIQADVEAIPATSGGNLQINGSSAYSLGALTDGSWATRSWNITGWMPGTYFIGIKCNSTQTGNTFSDTMDLEVNDTENPVWSNNLTSIPTGSQYSQGIEYQFNVTWNDNKQMSNVTIEHNFTGSSVPHNDTFSECSDGIYCFNVYDLPVGEYVWKFYGNDTSNNWNVTYNGNYWTYEVVKNTSTEDFMNLTLGIGTEGTESNYQGTYPKTTNTTGWYSSVLGVQTMTLTLEKNGVVIGTSNPVTDFIELGTGLYNYTYYTPGNENYTSALKAFNLTILQNQTNPLDIYLINSTGAYKNQNMTVTYPEETTANATIFHTRSGTLNFYRNLVIESNPHTTTLNAGTYEYKGNITGNQNYTSNSTGLTYKITVNKATSSCTLESTNGWSNTYPWQTILNCTCTGDGSANLYFNNVVHNEYNHTLFTFAANPSGHEIVCNTTEGTNYLSASDSNTLTIEKKTTGIEVILNGSTTDQAIEHPSDINMTGNLTGMVYDVTVYLDLNDTVFGVNFQSGDNYSINITPTGNFADWVPRNTTYNFTAHFDGDENHTASSDTLLFYLGDSTRPNPVAGSNSTNSTTAGEGIEHRLQWQDTVELSGYIFKFCNGTWNGSYCKGEIGDLYDPGGVMGKDLVLGSAYTTSGTPTGQSDSILVDSNNVIHILYADEGRDLRYVNSSDYGATFGTPYEIDAGTAQYPSIMQSSTGKLYATWRSADIFWANSTDSGATWTSGEIIGGQQTNPTTDNGFDSTASESFYKQNCIIDGNDVIHCCLVTNKWDNSDGNDYLIYTNFSESQGWFADTPAISGTGGTYGGMWIVNDNTDDIDYCDIGVDLNNNVYVVGVGSDDDEPDIWSSKDEFSTRNNIRSSNTDTYISIYIDENDNIHVATECLTNDICYHNTTTDNWDGTWTARTSIADGADSVPHVVASGEGDIFIVYEDITTADRKVELAYSLDEGVTWTQNVLIADMPGLSSSWKYPSVSGSLFPVNNRPKGQLHFSWWDNPSGGTYNQYYSNYTIPETRVGYSNDWINDVWVSFPSGGLQDWSNVTKVVNSTSAASIAWRFSVNDTSDNWNSSEIFTYNTIAPTESPKWNDMGINNSYPKINEDVKFSTYWTDDYNLKNWTFSWNATINGEWVNVTSELFSGKGSWSNTTQKIPSFANTTYGYRFYGIDETDIENVTDIATFTVAGYLEVQLVEPPLSLTVADTQNFTVNVTVYCRNGTCGNVNATIMYNASSVNPDTSISTTQGTQPFFVQESNPLNMKSCPTNILTVGEYCNITWQINASGNPDTNWKIGVLFNTTLANVEDNSTSNSTISIIDCFEDITLNWNSLIFSDVTPFSEQNPASGNPTEQYNITVNQWSCNTDLWIKGTDFTNETINSVIGVGNISWNNLDNFASSIDLSKSFLMIETGISENTNQTTYYWLNAPAIYAGTYEGNITIKGNRSD